MNCSIRSSWLRGSVLMGVFACFFAAVGAAAFASDSEPEAPGPDLTGKPQLVKLDEVPVGLDADSWGKIQARLGEQAFAFETTESGAFKARNAAHGFEIIADESGVRVKDSVLLRAVKAGTAGAEQDLPQNVRPTAQGARLEYERGNVIEWFKNRADGLEQGFTIARPADSQDSPGLADFRVLVDIDGARAVAVNADGLSARITDEQGRDFGYGGLKAWDSTGRALKVWMKDGESRSACQAKGMVAAADNTRQSAPLRICADTRGRRRWRGGE